MVLPLEQVWLHLQNLNLNDCELDKIPDAISGLVCLKVLQLANNGLMDIPPELASLTNLECLNLEGNCFPQLPEVLLLHRSRLKSESAWARNASVKAVTALLPLLLASNTFRDMASCNSPVAWNGAGVAKDENAVVPESGSMQLPGGAVGHDGTLCQVAKAACHLDVVSSSLAIQYTSPLAAWATWSAMS